MFAKKMNRFNFRLEKEMELFEIVFIGIGLAMDAFAVSVCKGLSMKKLDWKKILIIAVYFGIFQALMPVLGYFLGRPRPRISLPTNNSGCFVFMWLFKAT